MRRSSSAARNARCRQVRQFPGFTDRRVGRERTTPALERAAAPDLFFEDRYESHQAGKTRRAVHRSAEITMPVILLSKTILPLSILTPFSALGLPSTFALPWIVGAPNGESKVIAVLFPATSKS